jgi:5-methylcytosine-specific restriction endonuclease McrA
MKSTLKQQGFYHTPAWRRLRVAALRRDRYQCRHCLRRTATEVHHVKPLEDYPDSALDLGNLVSLCHSCHEATKLYGHKAAALPPGVRIIKA